jgi:hypothetical protein
MFIAVSKTGNPGDGWIVGAASATLGADIGGQLDYTSLATDGRSIFVTANVFDADGAAELGSQLFVWQGALGATTTLGVAAILDPSVDSALAASAELDTLQPAKMIGTPPGTASSRSSASTTRPPPCRATRLAR